MRTTITRGLVLVTAATLATVGTAGTAQASDTTTTFAITAGSGLAVSAPASKSLGSANLDASSVSAALGTVRVDDTRAALIAAWTAEVSSTDFVYDVDGESATTDDRAVIGKGDVTYNPGLAATAKSSPALAVLMGIPSTLDATRTAASVAAATGSNWAEWNPTLTVALPASGKVAGTYTGTVTHSVS